MITDTTATGTAGPSAQDKNQCPHWGQGGQYVADPVTGQRTRLGALPAAPGTYAKTDETAPANPAIQTAAPAGGSGAGAQNDAGMDAPGSLSVEANVASIPHQSKKVKTHG